MKKVLPLLVMLMVACGGESPDQVVVGSKNFTESVLLGEMLAQQIEAAGCKVDRKLNMGGTFVTDSAIRSGDLDTYVEYSGTALTAILDHETIPDRGEIRSQLIDAYEDAGLVWGPKLGFQNTFAMIVRRTDAETHELRTIGDLSRVEDIFQPGFGYEFGERPDGWRGLLDTYDLDFELPPRTMDLGLTYRALAEGDLDVIAGNSTDGLIEHLDLVVLEDDEEYFPPYDAVIVYGAELAEKCPGAIESFEALEGALDEETMRRLNYAVDGEKRSVASVAFEFLRKLR